MLAGSIFYSPGGHLESVYDPYLKRQGFLVKWAGYLDECVAEVTVHGRDNAICMLSGADE